MGGRPYWITGLAGAGKTTIGKLLYCHLKDKYPNTVFLDGDLLRQAFGNDLGYSEERLACAMRYARLSKLPVEQDMHVICCSISMFDEVRERNQKNLYGKMAEGNAKNVVGMDLQLQLPRNPDIHIINDGEKSPEEMCMLVLKQLEIQEAV